MNDLSHVMLIMCECVCMCDYVLIHSLCAAQCPREYSLNNGQKVDVNRHAATTSLYALQYTTTIISPAGAACCRSHRALRQNVITC